MLCASCGTTNPEHARFCLRCGAPRAAAPPPQGPATGGDGGVGRLIPYKNGPALAAYYCGVFGLIPCLGLPLALAAVILGFMGRARAAEHPETHGTTHAWVGIVLGALVLMAHAAVAALISLR